MPPAATGTGAAVHVPQGCPPRAQGTTGSRHHSHTSDCEDSQHPPHIDTGTPVVSHYAGGTAAESAGSLLLKWQQQTAPAAMSGAGSTTDTRGRNRPYQPQPGSSSQQGRHPRQLLQQHHLLACLQLQRLAAPVAQQQGIMSVPSTPLLPPPPSSSVVLPCCARPQIPVAFLVLGDQRLAGDPIYATSPLSCFMVLCSSSYFAYDLLQVGVCGCVWEGERGGMLGCGGPVEGGQHRDTSAGMWGTSAAGCSLLDISAPACVTCVNVHPCPLCQPPSSHSHVFPPAVLPPLPFLHFLSASPTRCCTGSSRRDPPCWSTPSAACLCIPTRCTPCTSTTLVRGASPLHRHFALTW